MHPISSETSLEAELLIDEEIAARIDEAAKSGLDKMRIRSCSHATRAAACARSATAAILATAVRLDLGEAGGRDRGAVDRRAGHAAHAAAPSTSAARRAASSSSRATTAKEAGKIPLREPRDGGLQGRDQRVVGHSGELELHDPQGRARQRYNVPYGAHLFVKDGQETEPDQRCSSGDIYNKPIVTERAGTVRFADVKEKITVRDEVDDTTGLKLLVIMEDRNKELQPAIDILSASGQKLAHYPLPTERASRCATGRRWWRATCW
jgi:DNA-directed RNA polymerase subunit beta'